MRKKEDIGKITKLPSIDYSKRVDIKKIVEAQPLTIKKKVKLTFTKEQYLIRIPKEIAEEMRITPENSILFVFTKPLPDSTDEPKLEITLV